VLLLKIVRVFLLSLHFALASVLGLIVGLLRPFNPDNSRVCARIYAVPALWILGVKVRQETDSLLNHQRPAVIVANHLSNYDLFVFGCGLPARTVSLGKTSLKWIPLFGQLYWLAGNVLIDRGNAIRAKQSMVQLTHTLQHKDLSIWVFVEGTRSHGKGLGPFKKGAFQMAINAGIPIVPVVSNTYVRQIKLGRWNNGEIILRSMPAIPTAGLTLDDVPALMDRCRQQMLDMIDTLDREAGTLSLPQ
jgi:1-acyl-sn-glycerol-3-phosphate acyltransferase